jgi:polyphosphate kinase
MRNKLVDMIRNEAKNAQAGLPSGICIKINSLQDKITIDELYKASQAGVPIQLIVRGICCIRPGRKVCQTISKYAQSLEISWNILVYIISTTMEVLEYMVARPM